MIVLHYGFGVQAVLLAGFISAILQTLVIICLQYKANKKAGINYHVSLCVTKKYLSYCLPLMFSGLIIFGLNGLERWLLVYYVSFNDIALYTVAFKFALILVLLMQPFGMWWMPKRFEYLSNNGIKVTTQITHISIVLLCSLTICVCFFSPFFIDMFMPENYHSAKDLVVILVIIFAIRELNELINMGALIKQETKNLLVINTIATVIGVLLILILTPIYKINGVLGALMIAQSIRTLTTYWLSQRCFYFPFAIKEIIVLFTITIISTVISQLQQTLLLHISSAVLSLFILLSYAFGIQLISFPIIGKSKKITGDNDVI
ncbi:lipopolysaccharide biosynthesis protein [Photobacterium aquimaris]|nr:hypothetical protein [Photobacterium aquimaris]